jgi:hypothetical protein
MSARTSPCLPISQPEAGEAVSSCTPRQTVRNTTAGSRAVLVRPPVGLLEQPACAPGGQAAGGSARV